MERERATEAARAVAAAQGLAVDEVVVLHASNNLTLRLLPCDVVARIARRGEEVAQLEVDVALGLAATGSPIAGLDPRVEARPHEADGHVVTFWTHHASSDPPPPAAVAAALVRLHAGLRMLDVAVPTFTDRVGEARALVTDPARTPDLADADRALLVATLDDRTRAILERAAPEQVLHGEPHPGNVLGTAEGVRFVDLETCCRGPVAFDVAHLPPEVADRYPGIDADLLAHCRVLVLALVACWRWDIDDRFPDGRRAGHELLQQLRSGGGLSEGRT